MRVRKLRRIFFLFFSVVGCAGLLHLALISYSYTENYFNAPPPPKNYFVDPSDLKSFGYIVNTPNCHILNISAFHPSILPLLREKKANPTQPSPGERCKSGTKKWTFVDPRKQLLILNETAILESGYSPSSIFCCYKSIRRRRDRNDSLEAKDADNDVDISSECRPLTGLETKLSAPRDQFIRVHCLSKYWPWGGDVVYRYFHATPLLPTSKNVAKRKEHVAPPSVILLGIDSMSRLSFIRNMPQTRKVLQEIGAVEMLGYTKLGENTYPNAIAFMTGGYESQKYSGCDFTNNEEPLDPCPFIWKDFSAAGYLTAFLEDAPFLATYNYEKFGFLESPVDYYLRPFMLAVNKLTARKSYYYMECLGQDTVDEAVLHYMDAIRQVGESLDLPAFIYAWLTNLAHGDLNSAQDSDEIYANYLKNLDLSNSILFFISDHGYRYGPIRQTFAGWYEDKLPNFWAYLPPKIRQRWPQWQQGLETNSGRLTSPLDLYATFRHILEETGSSQRQVQGHRLGQSIFKPVPLSRSCQDAGIPNNFCACATPQQIGLENPLLLEAAQVALTSLNDKLPKDKCAKLSLASISAGGVVLQGIQGQDKGQNQGQDRNQTLIVAFYTNPGGFLFEANVERGPGGIMTAIGEVLRMNKIIRDVSCVTGDLEKLCYCSPS